MDIDKLKQWMEITKNMNGGDFWNNIFDQDFAKQFMDEQEHKQSNMGEQSGRKEKSSRSFPAFDILEGDQDVMVIIELPGVLKENLELGLNSNILTIKGNALPIYPQLSITHSERYYGEFQRQITLPDSVNPTQLNAKFWHGLLLVGYQRIVEKGETIPID